MLSLPLSLSLQESQPPSNPHPAHDGHQTNGQLELVPGWFRSSFPTPGSGAISLPVWCATLAGIDKQKAPHLDPTAHDRPKTFSSLDDALQTSCCTLIRLVSNFFVHIVS